MKGCVQMAYSGLACDKFLIKKPFLRIHVCVGVNFCLPLLACGQASKYPDLGCLKGPRPGLVPEKLSSPAATA